MKHFRFNLNLVAVMILLFTFAGLASAQATRTWVSGVGDDVNPCSRTAPCKTFAGAISKTADGGEINCLDPGGYGAVTITKSITIDCGGTFGSILASLTNGIIINADPVGDVVTLRNLSIDGATNGLNGIRYLAAKTVHIENVQIFQFSQLCVDVATTANAQITLENVTLRNCIFGGIRTTTTVGTVVGDIHNARISNVGNGINAQNGSRLSVRDSEIAFANPGINQSGLSGAGSVVMVQGSTLTSNGTAALQSVGGATMTAFGNIFSANALIFNTNGGSIFSGGDNIKLATDAVGSAPGAGGKI